MVKWVILILLSLPVPVLSQERSMDQSIDDLGALFDRKMSELQARILLRGEECLRLPHGTVQSWVKGGYAPPADDPDGAAISLDESYHALDVSKTATDAEVKAAYRKKCAGFHPDKIQSKGLPPEFTTFANDQLARINQAHDLIRNPQEYGELFAMAAATTTPQGDLFA